MPATTATLPPHTHADLVVFTARKGSVLAASQALGLPRMTVRRAVLNLGGLRRGSVKLITETLAAQAG